MPGEEPIPSLFPDEPTGGSHALLVNPRDLGRMFGPAWSAVVVPHEDVPVGEAWFATVLLASDAAEKLEVWQDEHDKTLIHSKIRVTIERVGAKAKISETGGLILEFKLEKEGS